MWKEYDLYKLGLYKQAGLHEIDSTGNWNVITISINLKEYFETFGNRKNIWKKVLGKNMKGMDFERHGSKILSLGDIYY